MSDFLRTVRYALRWLRRSPGFSAVAILILAVGISANTAIFTVANSLLLRPLPFSNPDELMLVSIASAGEHTGQIPMSWLHFTTIRDQNRSFTGFAASTNETFNLSGRGEAEQIASARVTANFFDVLGVHPALGRTFLASEDQPGGANVALISHSLWMRRFGGAADVAGTHITLDSRDYTVVGVLPPNFAFALLGANIELWTPRVYELNLVTPQQIQGGTGFLTAVGRLRPQITREQAQSEMTLLDRRYKAMYPGRPDAVPSRTVEVAKLQDQFVANVRPTVLVLSSAVGLLLLIACANLASLLLSRSLGRAREIAMRSALGARRGVIVRQLLIESILVAVAGGALGILAGRWGTDLLMRLAQDGLLAGTSVRMDFRVLAFTAAISVASGVLFGLMPALQASRPDLNAILRADGGGVAGGGRHRARALLLLGQVALSMMLMIGAGLLIRSFVRLQTAPLGFEPKNAVTMELGLAPARYGTPEQMIAFYHEALGRAGAVPGVQAAAISSALPLNPIRFTPVLLEGQPVVPIGQRPVLVIQTISPNYPGAMQVSVLRGRAFTEHDDRSAARVAIVNQALAVRFWPNDNPIGKKLWAGRLEAAEVVGVFGDTKNTAIAGEAVAEVFLPFPQFPWPRLNLTLRITAPPGGVIAAMRREISAVDREQPVTHAQSLEELLAASEASERFVTVLLGVFSATALLLTMVGIYGVVAYSVAERTRELGIRMALGAERSDVLRLVVGQAAALTLAGIVLGLAGSFALTRALGSLLYRTSAADPATYAISAVAFGIAALAASYLPARRATRIDPIDALRRL
jgi:putative ABC transport system permease protein